MSSAIYPAIDSEQGVIFEAESWLAKIDFINQFILHNNVLISMLGETGSGKSVFASCLQKRLDPALLKALVFATPLFERTDFIHQICAQLNIEAKSSMQELLQAIKALGIRAFVIIDNAEQLPEAFVRELLDALKQQEGYEFLYICLLSDFSVVKMTSRLAREAYKDMIHSIELHPLNEAESKEYVFASGLLEESIVDEITDAWMHEFYQLTEGNFASMNTHMVDFFAKAPQKPSFPYRRYLPAGLSIAVLMIAGVSYLLFSKAPPPAMQYTTIAKNDMNRVSLELPLASSIPYYQLDARYQPIQALSLQKSEQGDDRVTENEHADTDADADALVVVDQVAPIPQKVQPVHQAKPAKKLATVSSKKAIVKIPVHARPIVLPHGQYTLQLMASRDKKVLLKLVKQYPAAMQVKVRSFRRDGSTWYVLTSGEYDAKPRAVHALTTLPKILAQYQPWIRRTSDLTVVG